jgi:hypothetical protein
MISVARPPQAWREFHESIRDPRLASRDKGRGRRVAPQQIDDRGVAQLGAQNPFQGWVDLGEEPANPVAGRVSGVGLGFAGVQVGDSAHGEPRQVAHEDAFVVGNGDRQRANRLGLVHDEEHRRVAFECADQLA